MSLILSRKAQGVKPSSTLAITAKAKELRAQGMDVIGFGAGEPDFNTPNHINEAAVQAIHSGFTKYTAASGMSELKEAVCKKFKSFNHIHYEPNQIVISNGAKHSLTNIFSAILNPFDEVLIPSPYWLSYPEIVKLADGIPVFIRCEKSKDYKVTAKQLLDAVTEKTKAFILNNPGNPTGALYTKEELEEIAKVAIEKDFYIIADEIYEHLVYTNQPFVSIASLGKEIYERTITCSGVSKSYSMTGWRIGYTGSSKEIAKLMGNVQSHQTSNPNSIAQKAAIEALTGEQRNVEQMCQEFDRRRNYMYQKILEIPHISTIMPQGAFYVFIDVSELLSMKYKNKTIKTAAQLAKILIEDYQVAVVPCEDFGFDDHIRLSYAISMEQIEKGLDRIASLIGECTN